MNNNPISVLILGSFGKYIQHKFLVLPCLKRHFGSQSALSEMVVNQNVTICLLRNTGILNRVEIILFSPSGASGSSANFNRWALRLSAFFSVET